MEVKAAKRDITERNAAELQFQHYNVEQLDGTFELNRSAGTLFTLVLHEKEPSVEK